MDDLEHRGPKGRRVSYKTNQLVNGNSYNNKNYQQYRKITQKVDYLQEIKIEFPSPKFTNKRISFSKKRKQANEPQCISRSKSKSMQITKKNYVKIDKPRHRQSEAKHIKKKESSKQKMVRTKSKSIQKDLKNTKSSIPSKIIINKSVNLHKESKFKKTSKKQIKHKQSAVTFKPELNTVETAEQKTQQKSVSIVPQQPTPKRKCITIIHERYLLQQKVKQRTKAVIVIQSWWRGYKVRRQIEQQFLKMLDEQDNLRNKKKEILIPTLKFREEPVHMEQPSKLKNQLEELLKIKQQLKLYIEEARQLKNTMATTNTLKQEFHGMLIEEDHEDQHQKKIVRNRAKMLNAIKWQQLIQERISKQSNGSYETEQPLGFSTNWYSIKHYLESLQHFINKNRLYLHSFARNLVSPFGIPAKNRLALLHMYQYSEQQDQQGYTQIETVLQESIFKSLQVELLSHGKYSEYRGYYNKAIFDCFNTILLSLRPFYKNDQPYPWSPSGFIRKLKPKQAFSVAVVRMNSISQSLCGLLVENPIKQEHLSEQEQAIYLAIKRQECLKKTLKVWLSEQSDKWANLQDEKTEVMLSIANLVTNQLLSEIAHYLMRYSF